MKQPRTRTALLSLVVLATTTACGGGTALATRQAAVGTSATAGRTAYPVTVDNCGTSLTLPRRPARAVSNDVNTTEDLLALGLVDRIAGTFGVSAAGMAPEYQAAFSAVHHISPKYVTLEPLVGARPDFLFAGWNYGLEKGSATLTPDALAARGIPTLALRESCAHVQPNRTAVSIDDTYTDLRTLGVIFDVQATAEQLITDMKATVKAVQEKVAGKPAKTVFLYDGGQDAPFTAPGLAMPNDLINLAGGRNVFADLKQTWTSVSWEKVVAADPDCILINDYNTPSWQQKATFLKTFALTKNLRAVTSGCLTHLRYDQLTPSPTNAQAVAHLAQWLHGT